MNFRCIIVAAGDRPFSATNENSFRTNYGLSAFYLPLKCSLYQRRPINNGGRHRNSASPLPCAHRSRTKCIIDLIRYSGQAGSRAGRQAGRQAEGRIDRSMEFFFFSFFPESPCAVDGRRQRRSRSNRVLSLAFIKVEGRGGLLRVVELHHCDGERGTRSMCRSAADLQG